MNLQERAALKAELQNDPLGRGYAGMTLEQKVASLTAVDRPAPERTSVSGSEIFNAIVPAEFGALTAANKDLVRDVFGLGDSINVATGTNARTVLLNAFGAGTATRTALAVLVTQQQSRASELGLPGVTATDIVDAEAS
jgi:hypothetical protein